MRPHWTRHLAALAVAVTLPGLAAAQEKVTFRSTDGDLRGGQPTTLSGYLYKPEGAGPFPAMVGLHGCNGLLDEKGKMRPLYGAWGDRLVKEGYTVLLVDSFTTRGYTDLCSMQPPETRPIQANRDIPRDVYGGLQYLQSRPDIKPNAIGILGQSFGGIALMYTVADDALPKDIPAEKDFRASVVFYPGCELILAEKPNWKPRQPMLFLMGEADNFTPAGPCKEMLAHEKAEGGPPISAHFYPDAYHLFDHPNNPVKVFTAIKLPPDGHSPTVGTNPEARDDAIKRVTAFLQEHLQ